MIPCVEVECEKGQGVQKSENLSDVICERSFRAIYTDGFERDTEIQIDGQLFGGVRGRVLFSTENLETGAEMDSPVARLKSVTDNRSELMKFEAGVVNFYYIILDMIEDEKPAILGLSA